MSQEDNVAEALGFDPQTGQRIEDRSRLQAQGQSSEHAQREKLSADFVKFLEYEKKNLPGKGGKPTLVEAEIPFCARPDGRGGTMRAYFRRSEPSPRAAGVPMFSEAAALSYVSNDDLAIQFRSEEDSDLIAKKLALTTVNSIYSDTSPLRYLVSFNRDRILNTIHVEATDRSKYIDPVFIQTTLLRKLAEEPGTVEEFDLAGTDERYEVGFDEGKQKYVLRALSGPGAGEVRYIPSHIARESVVSSLIAPEIQSDPGHAEMSFDATWKDPLRVEQAVGIERDVS